MKREEIQKRKLEERVSESTRELEIAREKLDKQKEEIIIQKQELKLREKDQEELLWFNQGIGMFSELISRKKDDLKLLSEQVIMKLVEYVEGQQGGVFLLNDNDEDDVHLELVAHYAYNIERIHTRFLPGEGYVGTCFVEKQFLEIDNLSDNYARLQSGLGKQVLRHLLLVPLKAGDTCIGVIELCSFRKIKGYKVSFVEKMVETLASTIHTERAGSKMKNIIEDSKRWAKELQEREEQIRMQLEGKMAAEEESERREKDISKVLEEARRREEGLEKKVGELQVTIKKLQKHEGVDRSKH